MMLYHKIPTVFERDPATNHRTLIEGAYATPELEMLSDSEWVWTEKVDGTNIRVIFDPVDGVSFGGKTDGSQIHARLLKVLIGDFTLSRFVGAGFECPVTLYGEGYGAKIQKAGGNYKPDGQAFVLFDVRCGDTWLRSEDVRDIADKMGIEYVPAIGRGTLLQMVARVRTGFRSMWGDFPAEGIVARPAVELCDRRGQRIITKIKHKDFAKEQQ